MGSIISFSSRSPSKKSGFLFTVSVQSTAFPKCIYCSQLKEQLSWLFHAAWLSTSLQQSSINNRQCLLSATHGFYIISKSHTHFEHKTTLCWGFCFVLKPCSKLTWGTECTCSLFLPKMPQFYFKQKEHCPTCLHFCPHLEWGDLALERESCFFWQMGFFRVRHWSQNPPEHFNFFPQLEKVEIEYLWIVKPRFSQDEFAKNKMLKFYSHCFLHQALRFLFVEALDVFFFHIYKHWIKLLEIGT